MREGIEAMSAAVKAIGRFESWFVDSALALWAGAAWDRDKGGFFEALDFNGAPLRLDRRVRVQARQIYTFARCAERGWRDGAMALSDEGFAWFLDKACPDDGARGCVHLLDDNGAVLDDRRDLYDQAFLLLACAARISAADDSQARALAGRVSAFLDDELACPDGGWLESDRRELPRRQNPHMHLFEAFIALREATGEDAWLARARHIVEDCFLRFMDFDHGVLRETFAHDFSHDGQTTAIEPGHMFEWTWLLKAYERLTAPDYAQTRALLYGRAEHFGADPAFHGFVSSSVEMTGAGIPGAKRLWPQTEYLRAACVQGGDGDADAEAKIPALIEALFDSYFDTEIDGLWIDEFAADGAPTATNVPASILYHLFEAVAETHRFASRFDRS